ncbi:OmpA family protein [Aliikangiella marina]|uniref:OmpA family protein n=1 Tax=Aliikangiella marina TaxID=1712262 RepID=A0A545TDJ5_9GAMM|nr:OmpA family protein [Aliikangiella marina]TQV75294.1 OmpA family protein [Aliikangiella marina]
MNNTVKVLFTMLIASSSCYVSASFKKFEAPMGESSWQFLGNPLSCQLNHSIPMYGDANFKKVAGKGEKLGFKLGYKRQPIRNVKVADVRAISPAWQPMQSSRELGKIEIKSGKHIFQSEELATWRLLNELEVGRFPTFYYQDFSDIEDQVSVSLSSVGFKAEYDKFLDCLASLVPYKINELTKLTLMFDFDRASIRERYKSKLHALAQYIKYDESVEVVFVSGYTDSKGSRYYNEKLAQRRIDSTLKILKLDGVPDNRFRTIAVGEKQPVASNRTASGRAKNRRVYIRIAQN